MVLLRLAAQRVLAAGSTSSQPTAEMRRRLERFMGLKPHQILKATKPALGDVRAPRQWDSVVTCDFYQIRHPLDRCVLISARLPHADDDEFFRARRPEVIVDGVLGLHVDDFIGVGEKSLPLGRSGRRL